MSRLQGLETRHGRLTFPAYIPVTTFGEKNPLEELVRPYLPRLAPAVMVSRRCARCMHERPRIPLLVASGGIACLFEGATIRSERGLGVLELLVGGRTEHHHPREVLALQEQHADIAFTLDFPIPPSLEGRIQEARRRVELTIANARWALENRRRADMPLYASVQGWDVESARACARAYAGLPFDGVAIGGLAPRARNLELVLGMIAAVRQELPDMPLHVSGLGRPDLVEQLFSHGIQSIDSHAYAKLAAQGRLWSDPSLVIPEPSPTEQLHLALSNLATATRKALPLPAARLPLPLPLSRASRREQVSDTTKVEPSV